MAPEQKVRKWRGEVITEGQPAFHRGQKVWIIKDSNDGTYLVSDTLAATNRYTLSEEDGTPVDNGKWFHESEIEKVKEEASEIEKVKEEKAGS